MSQPFEAGGLPPEPDRSPGSIPPEPALDRLTELAARLLGRPVALITRVDAGECVLLSSYGLDERWSRAPVVPPTDMLCADVAAGDAPLSVADAAREPRVRDRASVAALGVVAYAGAPLHDASGRAVGAFAVIDRQPHEWTAHERWVVGELAAVAERELVAEQRRRALAMSELRYRSLAEHNPNAVLELEENGRLRRANPACERISGFTVHELEGRNFAEFVHPEDQHYAWEVFRRALAGGAPTHWELRVLHRSGRPVHLHGVSVPVRIPGEPPTVFAVAEDVTAARELEGQFRAAQRMQAVGRLAGGIAHDFNNLLTAIRGYAELLIDALPPESERRDDAVEIRTAADRAAALTQQLLAFSRQQLTRPRVVRLPEVVRGVERLVRHVAGEDVELALDLDEPVGSVRVDPVQLEQLFINLVVNARDAMPRGGRLVVSLRERELTSDAFPWEVAPGRYVELAVRDTGIGMDEATRQRVFEPFFTTKEPGKGTGLGLSTVYGIVKQAHGHVVVESAPLRGTTVRILLPCTDGDDAAGAGAPAGERAAAPQRRGRGTVLVIEDEPTVRQLVARLLTSHGYTVLAAADGDEAMRVAAAHAGPIDLVLSDVVLPGANGRTVAARLGALHPRMRTILMSGYTGDEVARRGIATEGVLFLPKPFDGRELLALVARALGGG